VSAKALQGCFSRWFTATLLAEKGSMSPFTKIAAAGELLEFLLPARFD
jgi:hypothetical protein